MKKTQSTQSRSIVHELSGQPLLYGSLAIYSIALGLPSYRFQTPDRRIELNQLGIQSLLSPPVGIAFVVNVLYGLLAAICILKLKAQTAKKLVAILLLISAGLTCFGFAMGDPQPGSIVRFGPAGYLWVISTVTMVSASFQSTEPKEPK